MLEIAVETPKPVGNEEVVDRRTALEVVGDRVVEAP
jgi:hypothetical protein